MINKQLKYIMFVTCCFVFVCSYAADLPLISEHNCQQEIERSFKSINDGSKKMLDLLLADLQTPVEPLTNFQKEVVNGFNILQRYFNHLPSRGRSAIKPALLHVQGRFESISFGTTSAVASVKDAVYAKGVLFDALRIAFDDCACQAVKESVDTLSNDLGDLINKYGAIKNSYFNAFDGMVRSFILADQVNIVQRIHDIRKDAYWLLEELNDNAFLVEETEITNTTDNPIQPLAYLRSDLGDFSTFDGCGLIGQIRKTLRRIIKICDGENIAYIPTGIQKNDPELQPFAFTDYAPIKKANQLLGTFTTYVAKKSGFKINTSPHNDMPIGDPTDPKEKIKRMGLWFDALSRYWVCIDPGNFLLHTTLVDQSLITWKLKSIWKREEQGFFLDHISQIKLLNANLRGNANYSSSALSLFYTNLYTSVAKPYVRSVYNKIENSFLKSYYSWMRQAKSNIMSNCDEHICDPLDDALDKVLEAADTTQQQSERIVQNIQTNTVPTASGAFRSIMTDGFRMVAQQASNAALVQAVAPSACGMLTAIGNTSKIIASSVRNAKISLSNQKNQRLINEKRATYIETEQGHKYFLVHIRNTGFVDALGKKKSKIILETPECRVGILYVPQSANSAMIAVAIEQPNNIENQKAIPLLDGVVAHENQRLSPVIEEIVVSPLEQQVNEIIHVANQSAVDIGGSEIPLIKDVPIHLSKDEEQLKNLITGIVAELESKNNITNDPIKNSEQVQHKGSVEPINENPKINSKNNTDVFKVMSNYVNNFKLLLYDYCVRIFAIIRSIGERIGIIQSLNMPKESEKCDMQKEIDMIGSMDLTDPCYVREMHQKHKPDIF